VQTAARVTLLSMHEDPETKELRDAQLKREESESELARDALDEQESAQHERRAEKARYLREKLEERAEAERRQEE
jgi:hypothetical protein